MTENYFEMIKGLSPQEQQNVLAQVKEALIEKSAQKHDKAETLKQELSQAKDEDLADEVARFNPRTSDGNRYRKVRSELRRRLEAAAAERNQATVTKDEYLQQEYKRLTLTNELERLNNTQLVAPGGKPSEVLQRQREIMKELQSLPGLPDVIEPVKEVKENE